MDTEATHVLLVGGTGRFGHQLASALLSRPGIHLHVLVRPHTRPESLEGLADQGVTLVEGSLQVARSLDSAVEGMDVVVSAVRGGHDVMVEGQLRLLHAARRKGVMRFIPSDYSPDYFALREGEDPRLDWHRHVAEAVVDSGMRYTFVLCGAFMEVALSPAAHVFDLERGHVAYWGTGDEPFDVTSMNDVARFVAEAVTDRRAENRRVELVGDVVTVNDVARRYEALTGRQLQRVCRGTVEDLRRHLARASAPVDAAREGLVQPHLLIQLAGRGRLQDPDADAFARRHPLSVREYLEAMLRPWMASPGEASLPAHP
ncbi:aromatic alcohol reductase [Pyxidicoccus parkwayensis]|uniref:Aromatic alcohol reductase n=1 Tax=Pyxidicoccus parkwayensis TaxID=2813578 RepID=A0ABX7P7P2_9BACT|nr:aromatic alcohol reductase [Pyxidicoccus parkwaysis]QSQ26476.1 aromatic alcohol reductase [Pyxidicoccus parkwaysis]